MIAHSAVLFSGTATSSGDTTATPVGTKYDREAVFYLDITAASGANPTLDIVFKVYDDISGKWYELASFDRKTAIGNDVGFVAYGLDGSVAAFYTIGGGSPSFTFTISAHLKEG
jgi:hypothetical protein